VIFKGQLECMQTENKKITLILARNSEIDDKEISS